VAVTPIWHPSPNEATESVAGSTDDDVDGVDNEGSSLALPAAAVLEGDDEEGFITPKMVAEVGAANGCAQSTSAMP
jgi:hypothetical protein